MRAVEREFTQYFKSSLDIKLPELQTRELKLRVSGFPFCPLKAAYRKITNYKEPKSDALKAYYTSVGTAAHAVFQRFLGAGGKIFGDWRCLHKNCKHRVAFSSCNKCPKCGREMQYEELTVHFGKHGSGHLDGVFRTKDGKFYIIDYKTSSVRVINGQKYDATFPYQKNKAQIMAYVVLLEKLLNIKIEGWMLLYCFDPKTYVETDQGKIQIRELVRDISKYKVLSFNHASGLLEYKPITYGIERPCTEDMVEIEYVGGSVRVTEDHEVWSVSRDRYVRAIDIYPGEDLLLGD